MEAVRRSAMRGNIVFLLFLFVAIKSQTSPCPRLFVYEKKGSTPNRWYGLITLLTDKQLNGIWLRIILDQPSLQLGNWFGEPERSGTENKEFLVKNRNFVLKANTPHIVRFFVEYDPQSPTPRLVSFRLNGKTICPEDDDPENVTTEKLMLLTSGPGNVSLVNRSDRIRPRDGNCGTTVQPRPLITFGMVTQEGEFPWHAALYYAKGIDLSYICGASLISVSHVITVAHCVTRRRSTVPLQPKNVVVYLGKYYLQRFNNVGIQDRPVEEIVPHPKYDAATYRNDIAIVKLEAPVDVTDYVRPVCLWPDEVNLSSVIDKQGTVVGWGFDETGKVTETLMQAKMPVVSDDVCVQSFPEFFVRFTSPSTYCAGFRNGTSVCNGDSGGGMVFPRQTANGRVWELRGLVSISVALQNQFKCDTAHYVVFTDSAKYLEWIKEVISK
ncbi:limulus clotting factor C-like isoform X2 [Photinus pyralis]|uniref:limulus clotting factor C-like isoform X2 n=1 Tax=Photinus pyralis TaxID=7054 RepID=UPI001267595D|nr:limulus clotting factor C-like isoform X2 [Photinus pyralis]